MLVMVGEYIVAVVTKGILKFVEGYAPHLLGARELPTVVKPAAKSDTLPVLQSQVQPRPPSFCTGCPERPIFTGLKLAERELGPHHVASDIGCHLFSILPPFNIGAHTMGYG